MALDIEAFYERYGPMVLRRCRHLLRDDAKAEDALQDVFVALLRHEDRLHDEAPSALLLGVATNFCLTRMRPLRPHPDPGDALLLGPTAAGEEETGEGRTMARDLLGRLFGGDPLGASTRTMAVMHLLDGLTLEEVAAEVGMSVSGVRKRLRTLKARLSELEGV